MRLPRLGHLRGMARALSHRNYRLFFMGQAISLVGTWMQMVATSWLVYRLTGSPWWLGMTAFASRLPSVVLTPLAGVLIDRYDRRLIVLAAQILAAVQAALLAALTLTGHIQAWQVIALGSLLGVANAFDVPARQSMIIHLVEGPGDLSNAIALNSTIFNGAKLLGPSIAGVLTGWLGEGPCFLFNAVSYLAVIWALLAMDLASTRVRAAAREPVLRGLRQGLAYVWRHAVARNVILLIAWVGVLGTPYMVLLPKFAGDTLGLGSTGYGWLLASQGLGALCGAVYLANRTSVRGLERLIPRATVVFGLAIAAISSTHRFGYCVLSMLVAGGAGMMQMASANTLLQSVIEDSMRGRVMSLFALGSMGSAPLGGLLASALAYWLGVPGAMAAGGLVLAFGGLAMMTQTRAMQAKVESSVPDLPVPLGEEPPDQPAPT